MHGRTPIKVLRDGISKAARKDDKTNLKTAA